jgi:hypothetical protein
MGWEANSGLHPELLTSILNIEQLRDFATNSLKAASSVRITADENQLVTFGAAIIGTLHVYASKNELTVKERVHQSLA